MEEMFKDFARQMYERLDEINKKFDKIDEKFDKIDEKFDKIDEKFYSLDKKIDDTKDYLEEKIDSIQNNLDIFKKEILDSQFLFEQEYGSKIDIILDAVKLEADKNIEKSDKIRELDARADRTDVHLLHHEDRLHHLEKKTKKSKKSLVK